ncbi:hypothetical protein [Embleya sp. NPDC050493]
MYSRWRERLRNLGRVVRRSGPHIRDWSPTVIALVEELRNLYDLL